MKKVKVTIYLSEDQAKSVKKHIVDTGETLSAFMQTAAAAKMKHDASRSGKKKLAARKKSEELDEIIKDLAKA